MRLIDVDLLEKQMDKVLIYLIRCIKVMLKQ